MKLTSFEIKFDNPHGVFHSGEAVSGVVHLSLAKPMKMRRLKLFFFGDCQTQWMNRREKKHYQGKETYVAHSLALFPTTGPGIESVEHPAGDHAYPFSLTLLSSIPSSFEGKKGYIRYLVKASIERPWKFDSHVKRVFTVIHHHDLNQIPEAVFPQTGQDRKSVETCCCDAGSVEVTLTLNKTGYVPGEPIVYDIHIDNQSDRAVDRVSLTLVQTATYSGRSGSIFSSGRPHYNAKTHPFSLYHDAKVKVSPHKTCQINRATIVPSLPPSKLDGCSLINMDYHLELEAIFGMKCFIRKPVIIGTIPIMEPMFEAPTAPVLPSAPSLGPVSSDDLTVVLPPGPGMQIQPPSYEEALIAPPAYSECVIGRTNVQDGTDDAHTAGDVNWAPAYPYYDCTLRWNQTRGGQSINTATVGRPNDDDDD